jgi:hypothetical protein
MPSVRFGDFSAGLWLQDPASTDQEPGFAVPANALLVAENVEYLPSGGLRGRQGSLKYNAAALPGEVRLCHRHYERPGVGADLVQALLYSLAGKTVVSDASVGTVAWIIPAPGLGLPHATLPTGDTSEYCLVSNLGFAIPSAAQVLGVTVAVLRFSHSTGTGQIRDDSVRLFVSGVAEGDDKAETGINWPKGTAGTQSYGGAADVWGASLTPAIVNAADFGVAISAKNYGAAADTAELVVVNVTVSYLESIDPTFLVANVNGTDLDYNLGSAGVFAAVPGGTGLLLPTHKPRAVIWPAKGKTFLFDGTNPVKQFDGVTISDVPTGDAGIAPHRGPYAALYRDRLFATEPAELGFSVYATEINEESEWASEYHLSCNDPQGGAIAGLATFADMLIVLKQTCLFRWVGDVYSGGQLANYSDRGCVAPDTVQTTPWGIVYLARDGLYVTNGESPAGMELSRPLKNLFVPRGTPVQHPDAVGVYYPRKDQYWLKLDWGSPEIWVLHHLTVPTSEGDKEVFAWSRMMSLAGAAQMTAGGVWDAETDSGQLYVGDQYGFVRQLDVGVDDAGSDVYVTARTASRMLNKFRRLAQVYHLKPFFRGKLPVSAALYYDEHTTIDVAIASIGTASANPIFQHPRHTVTDMAHQGHFVSVEIYNPSDGRDFELHAIDLDVRVRGARRWP